MLPWPYIESAPPSTSRLSPGGRTLQGCICWPSIQALQVLPFDPAFLQTSFTGLVDQGSSWLGHSCCQFAETISPCCHCSQAVIGLKSCPVRIRRLGQHPLSPALALPCPIK